MAQAIFGAGLMWATPLQEFDGTPIANPTPIMIGTLQEVSLDMGVELKELFGSDSQYAKFVAGGKAKISGKAKMGTVKGEIFSSLFFGQAATDGLTSVKYDTVGTVIPTTPFEVTVTPPVSGDFVADLGVIDKATLKQFKRVASAPATGEYAVSALGVYTFASADAGDTVLINYSYNNGVVVGAKQSTMIAVPMGYSPTFSVDLYLPYNGKSMIFTLHKCISGKLSFGTKLDDFTMPEFEFQAFSDDIGRVATWSTSE
ncbi:MAG: hypothetical protein QG564_1802 [Campylobacterota bacterium]|nr:hypothetical protein [Campylobacterota bacterium]